MSRLMKQCLGFHSLVVKTVSQVVLVKASRQNIVKSFKKSSCIKTIDLQKGINC